jgi:hypothetical protein
MTQTTEERSISRQDHDGKREKQSDGEEGGSTDLSLRWRRPRRGQFFPPKVFVLPPFFCYCDILPQLVGFSSLHWIGPWAPFGPEQEMQREGLNN